MAHPSGVEPSQHAPDDKAVVVGVYGVPGSGKTSMLNWLKQELEQDHFAWFEGSEVIATVVPSGISVFQKLEKKDMEHWRQVAVGKTGKECIESGKVGVVAGHFMFWSEEEEVGHTACAYSTLPEHIPHILYLYVPAEVVTQGC
jgi:adenylylsulfate kinase-like enzyme